MIIDAHIHLWNCLHGQGLGIEREALGWGLARSEGRTYYATPPSFEKSLSTWELAIAHFDWLGIDRAVVLQEFMDGKQDDYLAQVRRECPERFSCTALFDESYFDDSMGQFRKAIDEKKLQGFLVITPGRFPEIAVPKLMPMWRECADRGLPIVLKDGDVADVRKLAEAIPSLKIVMSHFGAKTVERWQLAVDFPNIYIDSGGLTYQEGPYPWRSAQELLQEAIEVAGAEKIMWGSDYPRLTIDVSYREQLEFVTEECEFLTEEQKSLILGETAGKFYCWESRSVD